MKKNREVIFCPRNSTEVPINSFIEVSFYFVHKRNRNKTSATYVLYTKQNCQRKPPNATVFLLMLSQLDGI